MPDLRLTDRHTEDTGVGTSRENSAAGSHTHPHDREDHHEHDREHDEGWVEWARVAFVAAVLILVWAQIVPRVRGIDILAVLGLLTGGYPIFKEAIADLLERRMTMELSMTIALVAAAAIGEFFTALLITVFVLIAEILEGMTVGRGRRAIRQLLDLLPRTAEVRSQGEVRARSLSEVTVGDIVLVRPGGRIPVDGVVTAGHSFVDQSTITGESMAAEKIAGTPVFAGAINQSGVLEIRAEKIGRDTAFGRIIEAVERAEHSRAPVQRMADRFAGYLVYFALGCAALTFVVTHNARSTISVIVVAGACGIAAGTPLAILGAIGRAARKGAIVKGGLYLEVLSAVDTVVLDKTGTPDARHAESRCASTSNALPARRCDARRRHGGAFLGTSACQGDRQTRVRFVVSGRGARGLPLFAGHGHPLRGRRAADTRRNASPSRTGRPPDS